jgi:ActR/RegA family two-component response regulator
LVESRVKLLILDDDPRYINALTQRLSARDFDVIALTSGEQAIQQARCQELDIVLLGRPGDLPAEHLIAALRRDHPLQEIITVIEDDLAISTVRGSIADLQRSADTPQLLLVLQQTYQRHVQRKLALSDEKMKDLLRPAPSEPPLSLLRKLRSLSAMAPDQLARRLCGLT